MNDRKTEQHRHELRVGITILIGIGLLIIAIFSVGEQRGILQERYRLVVLMSHVNGLQSGAPVMLAGLRVGSVSKVEFATDLADQKIVVLLEIDKHVKNRITQDSRAHIGTLGLLGDKYVGINMGSPELGPLGDMDILPSSDPVDVEKLLGDGVEIFESLKKTASTVQEIVDKVNTGQGTFGKLINDPRIYFDLDRLLALTERLTQKIDSGDGMIAKLFSDSTFYINLNELVVRTAALSDSITLGKGTLGQLMRDPILFENLVQMVDNLKHISAQLKEGEGTIGKIITDEKLYLDMTRVTAEADSLIKDIRRNPQKYLKLEIF